MNKKIIGIAIIGIILVGIIMTAILGLNYNLKYRKHKEICFNIGQEFDNNEIKSIVKEVVGNKEVIVSKVEVYKDMVAIKIDDISDDELNSLNAKINEKYGIDNKIDDILIGTIPSMSAVDIIKPYIVPAIITFVIIEIYLLIYLAVYKKYFNEDSKLNTLKCMLELLAATILIEILFISVLAITRIPVNGLTMPIASVLFVVPSILKFIETRNK